MIAFDTDVFTEILAGDPAYVQRAKAIPREEQSVPIVVVEEIQRVRLLPHSSVAEGHFQQWRSQGIRVPTHDLRIAAICVAEGAKLVSRNRRDFEGIPGLNVDFW